MDQLNCPLLFDLFPRGNLHVECGRLTEGGGLRGLPLKALPFWCDRSCVEVFSPSLGGCCELPGLAEETDDQIPWSVLVPLPGSGTLFLSGVLGSRFTEAEATSWRRKEERKLPLVACSGSRVTWRAVLAFPPHAIRCVHSSARKAGFRNHLTGEKYGPRACVGWDPPRHLILNL